MRQGARISFRFASHLIGLALVIGLAAAVATPGRAEIYKDLRVTLNSMLAGIVGAPERAPRDLVINGQPLEFTPYQSNRSISDITDEWLRVLAVNTRPALPKSNDKEELTAVIAANMLIVPKTSRIRDDLAVVVRFFDGDGEAALDYMRRQDPEESFGKSADPWRLDHDPPARRCADDRSADEPLRRCCLDAAGLRGAGRCQQAADVAASAGRCRSAERYRRSR